MTFFIDISSGADLKEHVNIISRLRVDTFKEYPYLYVADIQEEKKYMEAYTNNHDSIISLAKINNNIVGILTGIPLSIDSEITNDVKKKLSEIKCNVNDYYYYGEVIISPEFRGKGISRQLCIVMDDLARSKGYKFACILTIIRPDDHPLKPAGYKPQDSLWKRLGFERTNIIIDYHWPTIQPDGSILDVKNSLQLWEKYILEK